MCCLQSLIGLAFITLVLLMHFQPFRIVSHPVCDIILAPVYICAVLSSMAAIVMKVNDSIDY